VVQLSGTVIFVRDVTAMATFYEQLSGWSPIESGKGFVRLGHEQQQIVIHAAHGVDDDGRNEPRVETPLKIVISAEDRSVLDRVTNAGGQVLIKREFTHQGRCHVDAVDPEGNILQLVFPA